MRMFGIDITEETILPLISMFLSIISTLLSVISTIIASLSFFKDSVYSVTVSEVQSDFFPTYFLPPLTNEGGNTSSAFIPLLVENNSANPVSITSVMLQDKYDKKIWHKAINWSYKDYSVSVPYFDGSLIENICDSNRIPINIPPFESRIVLFLFPLAGNNLMNDDFDTEFDEETGAPWTVPYSVRIRFSKRMFFFRKNKRISGTALVGKRIANSIRSSIVESESNNKKSDFIDTQVLIDTLNGSYSRHIECNINVTVGDIITDCRIWLSSTDCSLDEYAAFASIDIQKERVSIDSTATIKQIINGNHIDSDKFILYLEFGGVGGLNESEDAFRLKIETIPGISSFVPFVLVSTDYGESFVGLRVSSDPQDIVPVNNIMRKKWSQISSLDKEAIKTMICEYSDSLAKCFFDLIVRKRIPDPIKIQYMNNEYVFYDNVLTIEESCLKLSQGDDNGVG